MTDFAPPPTSRLTRCIAWLFWGLLPTVALPQSAQTQDPLAQAAGTGSDDILLVANISRLATNLDGSLRFARPDNDVEVSNCLLRDMTASQNAWSANTTERARSKALQPLLNVPAAYQQKGVRAVGDELGMLVPTYLRTGMGLLGAVRLVCQDTGNRPRGIVDIVYQARLLLVPAFLASAVAYEIDRQPLFAKDAEAYKLDRYRVIRRFTTTELQQLAAQAQSAKQVALELQSTYVRLVEAGTTDRVGSLSLGRNTALPTVCSVPSPRQRADAESVYATDWLRKNRESELARLKGLGDPRSLAVASSLAGTAKLGDTRIEKSLNEIFIRMSGALPCDVFIGSPKDVMSLVDALTRLRPRELRLGELRDESSLLASYAEAQGYARYADLSFGRAIGARKEQVGVLLANAVGTKEAYDALLDEVLTSGYSQERGLPQALTYLVDRTEGSRRGLTALLERDRRVAAERIAADQAEARRRQTQQALDREFPYEAVISCGMQGRHLGIVPCFAGESSASNTQLEIRSGEDYAFYQYFELQSAGPEVSGEGLKIALRPTFSVKVQNANANLTLTLKVVEKSSGRILFIKSTGQFGTLTAVH